MATIMLALLPAAADAARPIAFRITMGACPKGIASDDATLRVDWRDADGVLKATGTTKVSSTGLWVFCGSPSGDPSPEGIEPGDAITVAERGGTSRTLVVPRFFVRVDRQTDVVSGRAPAGTEVHVTIRNETQDASSDIPVDGTGRFSGDLTDRFDIRGGDLVTIEQMAGRDRFTATARAPWVRIWLGRALLDWSGLAGMAGLVTLSTTDRREATAPVGEGTGTSRFLDAAGDPVRARVGAGVDATVIARDGRISIPDVRLTIAPSTDVVVATCPAGLLYRLTVFKGGTSTARWERWGESSGRNVHDLTGPLDVRKGSVAILDCELATGDRIAIRRIAG
jgi:hypothetical protein